jgi:hypothetical protein
LRADPTSISFVNGTANENQIALALPQIKTGLIQLLTNAPPNVGWPSMMIWDINVGMLTLIGIGLAMCSV